MTHHAGNSKKKVIIDSDPAIGVEKRDIDDGLAILLLLASPEVDLQGITVTSGNVPAERGFQVANELLQQVDADIPVFQGASSKADLGESNPAVEFLIDTVMQNPGEISLVTVAPLTNVATAMMLDDTFAENLGELVIMGSTLKFILFSFFGEFNFHMDGKAASHVLNTPIPKTVISMDCVTHSVFQQQHLEELQQNPSEFSQYLVETIEPWLISNRRIWFRKKGFFPWDPVAVGYVLRPDLFEENFCKIEIQETGRRSGRILHLESVERNDPSAVNFPLVHDAKTFMQLFLERLKTF
ncbi:MAG: nucleoside hydrolase [Candidatus Thorarchaeota archaeon]|jgi:inosine-uridine nucleoside N-ribohydrolase